MLVGVRLEDAVLVTEHVELQADAGAILCRQERGELGLDLGLLLKEGPDDRVRVGVVGSGGDGESRGAGGWWK